MKINFLILLFFIFLNNCGKDDFKKSFSIDGLRVLAITAGKSGALTQAEFDPGDVVVVTPYVSDTGGSQIVTAKISSCTDSLGVDSGAEPTCENASDQNSSYADLTLDTSTLAARTGAMPSVNVTIPSTIYSGRTSVDQFNGINYLVTMEFSTPDGQKIKSFKRLRATTRSTKNQNPTIGSILFDGSSFTSYPESGNFSLDSYSQEESYTFQDRNGNSSTLTEELFVSWYVSDGEINFSSVDPEANVKFTSPQSSSRESSLVVVAVIRDARGGMAIEIKNVP
ncbi:MAG: hypothetical protein QE271_08520 [Bacteriovoracaceae bacterium]|nr:hypothetical protein [Bacteriovoracaceae bacterium]